MPKFCSIEHVGSRIYLIRRGGSQGATFELHQLIGSGHFPGSRRTSGLMDGHFCRNPMGWHSRSLGFRVNIADPGLNQLTEMANGGITRAYHPG